MDVKIKIDTNEIQKNKKFYQNKIYKIIKAEKRVIIIQINLICASKIKANNKL